MKLLLVEDDLEAAAYLKRALSAAGHTVDHAGAGRDGLLLAAGESYDVIILDRMLPEIDGVAILRTIRAAKVETPVLLLTAMGGIDDRVEGLEAGGDDYLAKPFAFAELLARVNALARRPPRQDIITTLKAGDLEMDLLRRTVCRGGERIDLQPREYQLLEYLLRHAGRVVTRTMLLEGVWDFHFDPKTNIVDTHISRLRGKLDRGTGTELIHTVRGSGYRLRAPEGVDRPRSRLAPTPQIAAAPSDPLPPKRRVMLRSSSLRLAALYAAAFALAVATLGAITLVTTRAAMGRLFDQRISAESASLVREYRTEGLIGVVQAVRERDRTPGALDYGLDGPGERPLAGRLSGAVAPLGWSTIPVAEPNEAAGRTRVLAAALPGGYRLLVGDDVERIEALDSELFKRFALALAAIVLVGVVGGYGLSRGVNRRIAEMTGTAEAIIDGDLSRRVPTAGAGDDLDRLAATFNRMLDRIAALMENVRHVSNDIAHDLRTPLTRLRTRLETSLSDPGRREQAEAIEAALGDLDAILGTFAALLRIAEIEAGARRAGFRPIDLTVLARTVVEAFAPSAEDAGQHLALADRGPIVVDGDAELITQMLVNLVENGLRHAGGRAKICVRCDRVDGHPAIVVVDDGPGVPKEGRERLFDRFHRLESSRSAPGSGLGLALVAAVAKLHGAEVSLLDAAPGLECRVVFVGVGRTLALPNVAVTGP